LALLHCGMRRFAKSHAATRVPGTEQVRTNVWFRPSTSSLAFSAAQAAHPVSQGIRTRDVASLQTHAAHVRALAVSPGAVSNERGSVCSHGSSLSNPRPPSSPPRPSIHRPTVALCSAWRFLFSTLVSRLPCVCDVRALMPTCTVLAACANGRVPDAVVAHGTNETDAPLRRVRFVTCIP